jgi:hypothetical protein
MLCSAVQQLSKTQMTDDCLGSMPVQSLNFVIWPCYCKWPWIANLPGLRVQTCLSLPNRSKSSPTCSTSWFLIAARCRLRRCSRSLAQRQALWLKVGSGSRSANAYVQQHPCVHSTWLESTCNVMHAALYQLALSTSAKLSLSWCLIGEAEACLEALANALQANRTRNWSKLHHQVVEDNKTVDNKSKSLLKGSVDYHDWNSLSPLFFRNENSERHKICLAANNLPKSTCILKSRHANASRHEIFDQKNICEIERESQAYPQIRLWICPCGMDH